MAHHQMTDAECDELLEQGAWAERNNLEVPHPMQSEFNQWAAERERMAKRRANPGPFRRIAYAIEDAWHGSIWW